MGCRASISKRQLASCPRHEVRAVRGGGVTCGRSVNGWPQHWGPFFCAMYITIWSTTTKLTRSTQPCSFRDRMPGESWDCSALCRLKPLINRSNSRDNLICGTGERVRRFPGGLSSPPLRRASPPRLTIAPSRIGWAHLNRPPDGYRPGKDGCGDGMPNVLYRPPTRSLTRPRLEYKGNIIIFIPGTRLVSPRLGRVSGSGKTAVRVTGCGKKRFAARL